MKTNDNKSAIAHLAKLPTSALEAWLKASAPHFPDLAPLVQRELDRRKLPQDWATVIQEVDGQMTQQGIGHTAEPFAGSIPEDWVYDRWINEYDEVVHQWTMPC